MMLSEARVVEAVSAASMAAVESESAVQRLSVHRESVTTRSESDCIARQLGALIRSNSARRGRKVGVFIISNTFA